MNFNLKLKERREKINQVLQHKRTKVMRKFKQVQRESTVTEEKSNPEEAIINKIKKYENVEKMIENFDNKMVGENKSINRAENFNNNQRSKKERDNTNIQNGEDFKNQKPQGKFDKNQKFNKFDKNTSNNDKFLNKKRNKNDSAPPRKTAEEIEKEKQEKLQRRKSTYRKLNRKTPKGQPVMKYQMENIFRKIKEKMNKGII